MPKFTVRYTYKVGIFDYLATMVNILLKHRFIVTDILINSKNLFEFRNQAIALTVTSFDAS
jgi:argonaute-like protein implicated in RNA metabolism and viral defense